MISLTQKLSDIVGAAFAALDLPPELGQVRVSDRPDLAQFQCNGAMSAAKAARKNPREVAQAVIEILNGSPPSPPASGGEERSGGGEKIFSAIEIAGPGFINLNITEDFLAAHLRGMEGDDHQGVARPGNNATAVLDYGGPNIAKAMHVGHLRAAIIGDSVRRIMGFAGYKTLGDVHMGDWGTHMGMLIDDYLRRGEQDMVLNTDLKNPDAIEKLMQDMAERYPRAAATAKEDETLKLQAQEATVKLQNKEQPHYALWQKIRDVSVLGMKKNYDLLGVHFDLWKGEADVHDLIAPMVEDLKKNGHAIQSEGAWVVPVSSDDDKKEMPPLILYKRDGAVMYGTTDLATLVERMTLYSPEKIVYIVDQRQSLHFEQVFRAVRKSGIVPENVELTHAGFGTMNGPDGKPFKTRAGGVMRLEDMIEMGLDKARERLAEANLAADMDDTERADVAHKVAISAIKFADLQNQRHADYIFDLDRLTRFEGKTGPYLLYQAVRIKSLLRKAGYKNHKAGFVIQDADRPLALLLTELPDAFDAALKNYAPHHLCEYAYKLAQAFSSFYGNCHILSEENDALKNSRLALCALTYAQLELVLGVLGIAIPDRM